jgi:hypothetical protein
VPGCRDIEVRPDNSFKVQRTTVINPGNVLKTYPVGSGFLAEQVDQIRLITSVGSHHLLKERAARIRTFVHSLRYKDVVMVVEEDGVSLVGFLELPPQSSAD